MTLRLALFWLAVAPAAGQSWHGRVTSVHDGDTLSVMRDRAPVKIRLDGIDCPESGQPFGGRAKQRVATLAFGNIVRVRPISLDRYRRTIAVITLPDGRVLNDTLVSEGLAWWYRRYAPRNASLARLEQQARDARRGLWADPDPVPPWLWRRAARTPPISHNVR